MVRRRPRTALLPYTALFRSGRVGPVQVLEDDEQWLLPGRVQQPPADAVPRAEALGLRIGAGRGLVADRRRAGESGQDGGPRPQDRKSTRLNSSHANIPDAVF